MIRNCGLKPRETKELPPEKLQEILSRIYPKEIVDDLMNKFVENRKDGADNGR